MSHIKAAAISFACTAIAVAIIFRNPQVRDFVVGKATA
jgi:hypothetical protein